MVTSMSAVRRIRRTVRGDHGLVALPHCEKLVLGHDVLALMLHVEVLDPGENDRIDGARLFAEAAVDALEEIDVIAGRAARAVWRRLRLDGDAHRRAHRLAELARDAALLTVRIAPQRMQPAVARRNRR